MRKLLPVLSSTLQAGVRRGLLSLALLSSVSAIYASDTQVDDIWYDFDSSTKTASVTYRGSEYNSYSNEYSGSVIIPETVTYDGTTYSVTSIGKYAFYDCSSLVSVTIPNSVTHIGDHAFYKTSSLTSVNIPNSVTSIGDYAFRGCSSLTAIDIPNSLTKIVHGMFDDCSSLATVTIPNSVTSIDTWAFSSCTSLTSITIPNSVTRIGSFAFEYCRSLTAITIPESVTDIGSGAFESCSSLTSVVWNAKKCGNRNSYNDGYTHFYFEIEFADSTSYSYEEIDEFVKQHFFSEEYSIINDSPFNGCDAIKSFSFGENVEFIPDGLCYGLDSITSITIPKSVWIIGERSFGSCGSLDTIYCYSEDFPVIRLTYLDVVVNMEMIFSYDADAPYIYDNTILYVPCQLLDAYKSQEEYTIRFPNIQCLEEDTPSQPQDQPTEGIGVFSIGEGKTVTFSPGNLQYTQSTDTWSFARVQYEVIGTNNVIGGSVSSHALGKEKDGTELADKIDLFGWSTSANNFGVTTSTKNNNYSGSFVDWGTNKIGNDAPNTWRTLTNEEWDYLLNNRKNASSLCGIAKVKDVNGLIILPDNWICPADITFKSGFTGGSYSGVLFYGYQTFSVNQWSKLEAAGAIFLPAAGSRYSNSVNNVQYLGCYWSATECNNNQTYYTYFDHSEVIMNNFYRYKGHSVRLVKDINSTTPEPPTQPQDTTIYHPTEYVAICEGDVFNWRGMEFTEAVTYTYEEIVEDENYIYHYIHTLVLQVIAPPLPDTIVVEAYDSYEWHGWVYTESGTYIYEEHCYQEILQLTIISSEEKEYVHYYYNDIFVCDGDTYEDPITGIYHLIVEHTTWSDTITGTEVDTIYTFNITPIVAPKPLTEDILYAIGAVPKLVAGEMVNTTGTTELIMWYYHMNDKVDIADVIGVEWGAGHDVVLNTEQTTHTMLLEVWGECDFITYKEFTFPVSKKDSAPQDTTIYHPTVYETICEGTTFTWMGMDCTEAGLYEYHEIVEGEDYTYHHIYTLELTILPYKRVEYEMIAYDSYEWHGWVYTESGTHTYQSDECTIEVLYLTIIPSGHNQGEVVVEPSTNSVTITWQKEESADSYIIVIKQGDKVVCTLIFDAEGNLVSVNYLPGRESNQHGIQHAGLTSDSFQYTITGLTPSTDYTYTVTATDDSDNTISSYSGEFTTHHATSVENTRSQSPTSDCQKILRNDQLLILRDGVEYTIMGQKL